MWIKFDLEGMKFEIQIKNQHRNTKYFDADDWAEVSFNVQFQNIIQYVKENDEILMWGEIENLIQTIKELSINKIKKTETVYFVEPDFEFVFEPDPEVNTEPKPDIKSDYFCGSLDKNVDMRLNIYLWDNDGMLTENYMSLDFGRQDIYEFYIYLLLVAGKIKKTDDRVQELINKGRIYGDDII